MAPPPADQAALASAHRARQQQLAAIATTAAAAQWGRYAAGASWPNTTGPAVQSILTAAQASAARGAQDYVAALLGMQGATPDPVGVVPPGAFAGVAADGRALDTLLSLPAFETEAFRAQGMPKAQAMEVGRRHLARIMSSEVADAARVSTGVAIVNDRRARGYIRYLTPPSCSRCVLLAGRWYAHNSGFLRHPGCDCIMLPAAEVIEPQTPRQIFDEMTPAEQDRRFTKAGADAIRDGADVARVVNARRGMYEAGGRKFTTEATTRRGTGRRVRLMPEQIYREAGDNRDEAIRLLKLHGYIL